MYLELFHFKFSQCLTETNETPETNQRYTLKSENRKIQIETEKKNRRGAKTTHDFRAANARRQNGAKYYKNKNETRNWSALRLRV